MLTAVVTRLPPSPVREDLFARSLALATATDAPSAEEKRTALRGVSWLLDHAAGGGLPLTEAGYLKPADVESASRVVPEMTDWIGKNNREINAIPLFHFREALKHLKILRTFKGQLLPTRRARPAVEDPDALWSLLAQSLIPPPGSFAHDATVLLLAHIGSTPSGTAVDPHATEMPSMLFEPRTARAWACRRSVPRHRRGRARARCRLRRISSTAPRTSRSSAVTSGTACNVTAPSQLITDLQSITDIGGRQLPVGRQYSRSRSRSALPEPLNGKSPLPDPRGTAAAPHACPP